VAHAQGYSAHGVAVEIRRFTSGRDALAALSGAATLKLHLQSALRRWSADGEAPPAWHAASVRQLARLEGLIADLLDLGRIRAGGLQLRREPVNLSELVRGTIDRMRVVLSRSDNVVEADIAPSLEGNFDGGRIEQVLTNLLSNAAQYAPGAPVRVRLRREGERTLLVVEDGGPGVPGAARERIFARYERAEPGRASSGLGLGLYIARQIVDAHGGTISVGESPLGGAAFTLDLPAVDP
jgi:signal transduction histidine kinase